jgi:hypothetical protein
MGDNSQVSHIEATIRAYNIVATLIFGFLDETKNPKVENDRQVLQIVKELGEHCEKYSRTLNNGCRAQCGRIE